MKRNYKFKWLTLLFTIIFFGSCSSDDGDDLIWDIAPVNIYIQVCNQEGENLLDENVEGNILENEIKITYKDEEYLLGESVSKTRAYMPSFNGLQLYNNKMIFGEFEGAASYTLTATLDLGNGIEKEVGFIREYKTKNGEPQCSTIYTLDGEELEGGITIIL
ncbi:MAG: hypothetical protein SNG38_00545 [Rikenellaceae bacterium]